MLGSSKEDMVYHYQYPDGELRNCQEFITLNPQSNDYPRYRAAGGQPFDGFLGGVGDAGAHKDYRFCRPASPEIDFHVFEGENKPSAAVKPEASDTDLALFRNMNYMNTAVGIDDNSSFNGSHLLRQNSSPAAFFSNLGVHNGFSGSSKPSSSSNINFSLGSMYMPQMSEDGTGRTKRQFPQSFQNEAWDDDQRSFHLLGSSDNLNASRVSPLTHHLSLPTPMEKALHLGGAVPCKVRAKRGCATHPRSIAERVRRTRISERMRKLQDLFPDMDKNTSTADMLEMAVEHIKDLQSQVKTMSDIRAKCTCPRLPKQCSV